MDFLDIRKKAKERAAGRRADGARSPERPPAGAANAHPVGPDADGLDAEPPSLQGAPAANDDRFTTWRPGAGAPPVVPEPGRIAPAPSADDFTLVARMAAPSSAAASVSGAAARRPTDDPLREFFYRPDEECPAVPDLGGDADMADERDLGTSAREEYLTFLLGTEEYAVAIERVREVMKACPITEVPRAPAHVLGVVTVRGEVVAVFDPRRRLGLPGTPPTAGAGRIVIVDPGDGACGLLVDAVASVVRLRPGSLEACPQGIGGAASDCLAGIGREGERLFTVLDLGALFRRPAPAPRRAADGGGRVG